MSLFLAMYTGKIAGLEAAERLFVRLTTPGMKKPLIAAGMIQLLKVLQPVERVTTLVNSVL